MLGAGERGAGRGWREAGEREDGSGGARSVTARQLGSLQIVASFPALCRLLDRPNPPASAALPCCCKQLQPPPLASRTHPLHMAGGTDDEGASVLETPPLVLAAVFGFFLVVTLGTDWVSCVVRGFGGERRARGVAGVTFLLTAQFPPPITPNPPTPSHTPDRPQSPPLSQAPRQAGPAGRARHHDPGVDVVGCCHAHSAGC